MAVSNKGGHGVTNMAGNHNMESQSANVQFPNPPAHQSGGMGGPTATDSGAYASRGLAKKKGTFPPAR